MLTVVTPATTRRLTTLGRARALLGFSNDDDEKVDLFIDQASQAVVDYCHREFARETVRERQFPSPNDRGGFILTRQPVESIVSVTYDGAVLGTGTYGIYGNGLYQITDGAISSAWSYGHQTGMVVEYVGGYRLPGDAQRNLPPSVERACILMVGSYLSSTTRDPTIRSETVDGIGVTAYSVGPNDVSPSAEVKTLLQPYRSFA